MMHHLNTLALSLSLLLATGQGLADPAGTPPTSGATPPPAASSTQPTAVGAHLGALVRTVPPALAAQLPATVPQGQGVMIVRVEPGSPAAEAGLQPYDILLRYDDQKLFSANQLSGLVASDQPNRQVRLQLVRGGQLQEVQIRLGAGAPRRSAADSWFGQPFSMPFHGFPSLPQHFQTRTTEHFESLHVERLDDGRYRASIEYLDGDGAKKRYVFEGTQQELRDQIRQSNQLPPKARNHLLRALNMRPDWIGPRFWGPMNFEDLMRTWREGGWMQY